MSVKTLTKSFGAGEITPELFGRIDLANFQTGLKKARNFEILPHGPAANRTGLEYTLETKFSSKKSCLLPFIYNAQQTYQLEFGDLYVRFHTNNGTVLNAAGAVTGATNANPGVFTKAAHGFANGTWLFLSGFTGGWAGLNGRFLIVANQTLNTFTLQDLFGVDISTLTLGAFAAGNVASVYEIVSPYAATDLYDADGVLQLHYAQSDDVFTLTIAGYQSRELKRSGPTSWAFNLVTVVPVQTAPTAPVATATGAGAIPYFYVVTSIAVDSLEESVQSASCNCNNDITVAGQTNKITFTDSAPAGVRYQVYKRINGVYGFIGQCSDGVTGFVDNNITPNLSVTPPLARDPISAVGDYPNAVGYFQQRRWFGGSTNKPLGVSATRSGTDSNMTYSIPTQANDSLSFKMKARQNSVVRHIIPMSSSDLILLTSGAEFKVSSDVGPVAPLTVKSGPEDFIGASNATPITTASSILYAADRGGRLRELTFIFTQQGWRSADISIMAPHLFDGYKISSLAYARAPYSIAWATRSDGQLLGLTYISEHKVAAWHHHDTSGSFENVCVTPEGAEDVLYAIVNRTINGVTKRYIERQRTRLFGTLPLAFFVDSGLTYNGTPTSTITGLWHLEGQTVAVLVDGAVQTQKTVVNGSITLDAAGSVVNVGLPYIADLETLPLAIENAMAAGQGMNKNINAAWLRLNNSSGVFVGPTTARLTELKQRTTEPYGSPPALMSDVYKLTVGPSWNYSATMCVRQSNPLPVTVLSLTLDTAEGG